MELMLVYAGFFFFYHGKNRAMHASKYNISVKHFPTNHVGRSEMLANIHSKKCWVVLTQLWVKYGLTQPLGYIFTLHF